MTLLTAIGFEEFHNEAKRDKMGYCFFRARDIGYRIRELKPELADNLMLLYLAPIPPKRKIFHPDSDEQGWCNHYALQLKSLVIDPTFPNAIPRTKYLNHFLNPHKINITEIPFTEKNVLILTWAIILGTRVTQKNY